MIARIDARVAKRARGLPGLSQLDFAVDLVGEADAAERHRRAGGEGLIALEPALRKGVADRLFDLALGGHAERLEKLPNAGVEDVFVHGHLLCTCPSGHDPRLSCPSLPCGVPPPTAITSPCPRGAGWRPFSRVPSFAVVNYRQGADRDPSSNLAYFDRVDAVTKDQKFSLAIWGRLSRTERGVRIDSFLQVPGDADKSPYVRTIRLLGGTLTARLKPDRILLQSLDVDPDGISLLQTAAEQVARLRASPAADAPVIGRLGDDSYSYGTTHRIVGSQPDWIQLQLTGGRHGWTSVDQFCTGACRALLDVASFANDVVALTSGSSWRPVSKNLTREAEAMSEQLAALMSLSNNPNIAVRLAE